MGFLKMLQKLFPIAVVFGLLAPAAHAQSEVMITTTKTASSGKARAELSYQTETFPDPLRELRLYQPRLKLMRDGRTLLEEALPASGKEASLCHIDGPEVRDLDGDGEPEILLSIREDFKHPGSTLIYRYNAAANRYVLNQQAQDEKLQVSNKLETRRVSAYKKVKAELAFHEDIMVQGEVTLTLTHDGQAITERVDLGKDDEIATVYGPAIIDLDGQGEAEVVLNVFSQHAYCCAYTIIYYYLPTKKAYNRLKHSWGPYRNSAVLKKSDRDGVPEFISRNEDFSGEFGPYAVSGASPIQIWRYRQGRMLDVTRRYPKLIREDAKTWWDAYTNEKSDWYHSQVPLAAYLADMHMLGEGADGWKRVREVYKEDGRQEFFHQMHKNLKKHGYAKE